MGDTATATAQEFTLDQQARLHRKLDKIKVGDKLAVAVNSVSDQGELFCVERTENPPCCKFTFFFYGVATGKELVASKELNKWSFK
jgi:hypothetical protein